jgi:prepilin-type N-terminal cleavage/methylation domain-containing protein
MSQRSSGFTLPELMIVLAIVSMAGLIAYPRFRDLQQASATRSAARGLVFALKGAQHRAAGMNRPAVAFIPDSTRIAFYVDLDLDGAPDLPAEADSMRFPGSTPDLGYPTYALPQQRALREAAFPVGALGKPQFTLRSDGTVTGGGTVQLADHRGVTYLLQVTPTGVITLSRVAGS